MTSAGVGRMDKIGFGLALGAWAAVAALFSGMWSFPFTPLLLAIPVLAAGLPLVIRPRGRRAARIVAAVVLFVFVVLGMLSVGVLFLPAAVLMLLAAVRPDDEPAAPPIVPE